MFMSLEMLTKKLIDQVPKIIINKNTYDCNSQIDANTWPDQGKTECST